MSQVLTLSHILVVPCHSLGLFDLLGHVSLSPVFILSYLLAIVPDHSFGLLGVHAVVGAVVSHPDIALVGGISWISPQMKDGMPAFDGHHRFEIGHASLQKSRNCLRQNPQQQKRRH